MPWRRLFYGTKEDTYCDAEDEQNVHHKATDKFSQVVLQVSHELGTLNDALEYDTTPNEVDGYTTAAGMPLGPMCLALPLRPMPWPRVGCGGRGFPLREGGGRGGDTAL